MRPQLHQAAARSPEPEIPFTIFANGPDIIWPAIFSENHGLKPVVFKTEQAAPAGADPNPPIPPFTQTPDPHGGRLGTAEIIESFAFGQVDQIGVAEGPQIAMPVLISTQIFGTASLTLGLKRIGCDVSVNEPAHPGPRGDPNRSGTRHVQTRNGFIRQTIAAGERLEFLPGPKAQS